MPPTSKPPGRLPPKGIAKMGPRIAVLARMPAHEDDAVLQSLDSFLFSFKTDEAVGLKMVPLEDAMVGDKVVALGAQLRTRRHRPVLAMLWTHEGNERLVFAMRGTRDLTLPLMAVLPEPLQEYCPHLIHAVEPGAGVAQFHPWFSSIVVSARDSEAVPLEQDPETYINVAPFASVTSRLARLPVCIMVLPPCSTAVETALHRLAIDVSAEDVTLQQADEHAKKWSTEAGMTPSERGDVLAVLTAVHDSWSAAQPPAAPPLAAPPPAAKNSASNKQSKPAPSATPKPAASSAPTPFQRRSAIMDSSDDSDAEDGQSKKPTACKFVAGAAEASSREDEREARKTRKFEKRVAAMDDSDDSDKDLSTDDEQPTFRANPGAESSDDEKIQKAAKKAAKRERSASGDEESLSSDSNDESGSGGEDSSSESASGSESGSESGESVVESVPSSASGAKRKRLVKGEPPAKAARPTTKADGRSARAKRVMVASQAKQALNSIDACVGVPVAHVEAVKQSVQCLRESFDVYESDRHTAEHNYALFSKLITLLSTVVDIVNAQVSPEQHSHDAALSRGLAVSATAALIDAIPALAKIKDALNQGVAAVETMEDAVETMSTSFKESAVKIAATVPTSPI